MLIKSVFYLFLGSTILSPVYGMDPIIRDEIPRLKSTSPKPSSKFPAELNYDELCQIFGLSDSKNNQTNNKVTIAEWFLVSHKMHLPECIKIKSLLVRTKGLQVFAVGEILPDNSYTMGSTFEGSFVNYHLYKDNNLLPSYSFLASVAKPKTTVQISPQPTLKISNENLISSQVFPSKQNAPRGFEQENYYLDFVVDLLLGDKMPNDFKTKPSKLAELLVYSYPAFTTEKNIFSLLNIFIKEFPEAVYLEKIICFLQTLEKTGLPNGQKNLKKAEGEFDTLSKILETESLQEDRPRFQYINDFNKQVESLKISLLGNAIKDIKSRNDKERKNILALIKLREPITIDGTNLNNLSFMNALLKRDLALSRMTLRNLSNPESNLWKIIGDQASQTSYWVALQYLSLPKKEDREILHHKFSVLYRSLLDSGNLHGAIQIAMGFRQSSAIRITTEDQRGVGKEKMVSDMGHFLDPKNNFKAYRDIEFSSFGKKFFPSFYIMSHDILLNSESSSKAVKNSVNDNERLNIILQITDYLKTVSRYQTPTSADSDLTYLKAVCNFKIHPEVLEVYSDLLYEWPTARSEWATFKPKTLEEWTPGYFAHLMRENGCAHTIEIYFKNGVYDGQDIINRSKMQIKKLRTLGGIRGLSDEMINCIMSAPRNS